MRLNLASDRATEGLVRRASDRTGRYAHVKQFKRCNRELRLAPDGQRGSEADGRLQALSLGLSRAAAFARPLANQIVLLAQAHFVLPPQLDRCYRRQVAYSRGERAREVS